MESERWPMTLRIVTLLCSIVAMLPIGAVAATRAEVDKALAQAKQFLYSQQNAAGHWETAPPPKTYGGNKVESGQWGGMTAIAAYALLASGESHQNANLAKAIDFLKKAELQGVYALGMRMQVWYFLPQVNETKQLARADAQRLLSMVLTNGPGAGHYGYTPQFDKSNAYSHSRSQYGTLGIWAAAQMGMEIPNNYWALVERGWVNNQDPSGGWTYQHPRQTQMPLTPGMTAAGVASLFIASDYLYANQGLDCRGGRTNPAIDKGLDWISKHFDMVATSKRYERDFPVVTLYAIERIGVASGLKYLGTIDWYKKGSDWLIKTQKSNGSWTGSHTAVPTIADTAFGMLFLSRARAPLVMNKLDYSDEKDRAQAWNQRPRDAANLARWIGRSFERDLNWQIVNLRAPVDDLSDAPILYIAGSQTLDFSDADKAKLQMFVEQGGLILGHADCGSRAFADSFRKLIQDLFPACEFRELPANHLIFTNQFHRDTWKTKPSVLGLSNGVRELALLIPQADPGRFWHMQLVGGREEMWQLGANIFLYAVDRQNFRLREESHLVHADPKIKPTRTVNLARLEYASNWNPEPGGWRRLAAVLHNEDKLELSVRTVKLGEGKLAASEYPIAHLTGTAEAKLTEAQMAELRQYLAGGGTLIVDAAGGSSDFAAAIEPVLGQLVPDGRLRTLPESHAIYSAGGSALDPKSVKYRQQALRQLPGLQGPRLQGADSGHRLAIIYSREDLSAGLTGAPVDGVVGYEPDTATDLMRRIILNASASPATSAPSKNRP